MKQEHFVLTKKMIKQANPHSIIHEGYAYIEHPWFNQATKIIENDGRSVLVKYVVYRGGIEDWCIYHSLDANFIQDDYLDSPDHLDVSYERIAKSGAKLHREDIIREIIDCTDEVFEMYRH